LWLQRYDEELTTDNKAFVKEIIHEKYGPSGMINGLMRYQHSPLKTEPVAAGEWFPGCRRSGLIGLKIGVYPHWTPKGDKVFCTLIQVRLKSISLKVFPGNFIHTE